MADDSLQDLHCTCYRLRKATRQVTALYDEALAPVDLTITQMSILAMVASAGARPMSALAHALGMDNSTVSRTLRPLVARGVLETGMGADRRVRQVRLTSKGRSLLAEAVPLWRKAQAKVQRLMGAEAGRLHELLGRLSMLPQRLG